MTWRELVITRTVLHFLSVCFFSIAYNHCLSGPVWPCCCFWEDEAAAAVEKKKLAERNG